jgi:hypothetical protein
MMMKILTKIMMKIAMLKAMVKTMERITSNKTNRIIKKRKLRIILTKKTSSLRIIINKINRQNKRNHWMTRSLM